ncbi:uncharacterized protein LOC130590476 [Beta vulgaris subsp. vulgaris]|uniref:uncharacterized protein LOC130590476 n=1 Tax=Beta vulgaris subsp. vulgaris TaxID=3555 RepID=UPI002549A15B|nr:uncharacterized protein LOC130590476 [Beta vulgaris subsp. vulgaris]
MGLVLQNQLGNNGGEDPQAAMAKKLATLKPPIFVGKEDPLLLENWLRDFDKLFTATGTPEAQKVDQATFYLREDADTWWESQGPIVRAQENFNWNAFKVAIKDRFFPEHIRRQKYNEFTRFNQGGTMSVQEYAQKFNELARFCPNVVPDERAKAQKFEDGLAFRIQTRPSSFVEKLGLKPSILCQTFITIPSGEVVPCSSLYQDIPITILGSDLPADLIQFDLPDFDVILGMDWLAKYRARIECHTQKVSLRGPKGNRISYQGIVSKPGVSIVSAMSFKTYIRKGYPYICAM